MHDFTVTHAILVTLGLTWFAFTWWQYRRINHARSVNQPSSNRLSVIDASHHSVISNNAAACLIVYASESGQAKQLAEQLHCELQEQKDGFSRLYSFTEFVFTLDLDSEDSAHQDVIFIVSTAGDGAPPAMAHAGWQRLQTISSWPRNLSVCVLALGDRNYLKFCAFGHALQSHLQHCGAQFILPLTCVDQLQQSTIIDWRWQLSSKLSQNIGSSINRLMENATPCLWRLTHRQWLNENDSGVMRSRPLFHLGFKPLDRPSEQVFDWLPGDLVDIHLNDGSVRTYSIASIPESGQLDLIVRQVRRPDGILGKGSGWLTERIDAGSQIDLKIRRNIAFHPSELEKPAIFIAAGSGYAGIRAHLQYRTQHSAEQNWLIFGERSRRFDSIFSDETRVLREQGLLVHEHRVFSRPDADDCAVLSPRRCYVQDILKTHRPRLQQWLMAGATIYICGGQSMGAAVLEEITTVTGSATLALLKQQNRIRCELY